MPEHNFLQEITSEAKNFIRGKIRELNPIFLMNSNVQNVYDCETFRDHHKKEYGLRASCLLDTNIVSALNTIYRKTDENPLNEAQINACILMCFLIYSGIEANPTLAFFERPKDPAYPSREEDDLLFRIADHLPPQSFADLAMGKIYCIPSNDWQISEEVVNNNPPLLENIQGTVYPDSFINHNSFKIVYSHILKALILKNEISNLDSAFSAYLRWAKTSSLFSEHIFFIISLLANSCHATLFKNRNSKDTDILIKQAQNTTVDLIMLTSTKKTHSNLLKENSHSLTLFATFDKKLLSYFRDFFSLTTTTCIDDYITNHISHQAAQEYQNTTKELKTTSREAHAKSIYANLDTQISSLEEQLSNHFNVEETL